MTPKELNGPHQFPSELDFEKIPSPKLVTAYDIALATDPSKDEGKRYKFGMDRAKLSEYFRSIADRLAEGDTPYGLVPQAMEVVTRAVRDDYAMTYLMFQFAEKQ